jgi:hypothetical protein
MNSNFNWALTLSIVHILAARESYILLYRRMVSELEKAFYVLAFHETKFVETVQRQFRRKYEVNAVSKPFLFVRFQVLTRGEYEDDNFSGIERLVVSLKKTDVSEVRIASIIRAKMMETIRISETSVCFNETTLRYITESCLHYLAAV